jgi:hypothetical protein
MLFILRAGLLAFVLSCIHSYIHIVTFAAPVAITSDNFGYSKTGSLSQRSVVTPDKSFANPDIVHLSGRSGYLVAQPSLGIDTSHSPIVRSSWKHVMPGASEMLLQTQEKPRLQVLVRRTSIFTKIKDGFKWRQWVVLFSICRA